MFNILVKIVITFSNRFYDATSTILEQLILFVSNGYSSVTIKILNGFLHSIFVSQPYLQTSKKINAHFFD